MLLWRAGLRYPFLFEFREHDVMRTGSLNLIFAGIMNIKSRGRASAKLLAKGRFYFKIELSK